MARKLMKKIPLMAVLCIATFFLAGCLLEQPPEVEHCKVEMKNGEFGYGGDCVAEVAVEKGDPSLCKRTFGSNADSCLTRYAILTNDPTICDELSATASVVCYQSFNMTPPAGTNGGIAYEIAHAYTESERKLPSPPESLSEKAYIYQFSGGTSGDKYGIHFAIDDGTGETVNAPGTGKVIISDQGQKLFETEFPIEGDEYSKLSNFIGYSEVLPITQNELLQMTNASSVELTFIYTGCGRTLESSSSMDIRWG